MFSNSLLFCSMSETVSWAIFKLGIEGRNVLLLPGNNVFQLPLVLLNVRNGLLGHLQLTLNLPPLLFNISTSSLLPVSSIFKFIKSGLQLGFDRGQMRDLLFSNLQVFNSLGLIVSNHLLFLVQLIDDLILLSNFIIQASDVVISVGLLLFQLLQSQLKVFNILLDNANFSLHFLLISSHLLPLDFLIDKLLLSSIKLVFHITFHTCSLSLPFLVLAEITLL